MKLFADDTKLWTKIRTEQDGKSLQKDLDMLAEWSNKWQLKFNPEKCKIMHIGHSVDTRYSMEDGGVRIEIQAVSEEKDLGVYFTNNLKPARQCVKAAAKARSVLAMVKKNFRRLDICSFQLIYKTYIRPHLEFCIQVWSPHLKKDIECLEKVQRAATRLVPTLRKYDYQTRLQRLRLTTLTQRRKRGDAIETFKLLRGKEKVGYEQFYKLQATGHDTRGHSLKLQHQRSRLDIRRCFFTQRTVGPWNSLPQHVIEATTVNSFKDRYDKYMDMSIKGTA